MATNRRKKKPASKPDPESLETPTKRAGFRDPDYVQSVVLRMGTGYIDALDELCEVNKRSRRQIVEILITEASDELQADSSARITPL